MIWFVLASGIAFCACGIALPVMPQYRQPRLLLLATANALMAVANFLIHDPLGALPAAMCAYCLWLWWRNGGGDGTKRRLRELREKFTPARRTAPAAAMAVTR